MDFHRFSILSKAAFFLKFGFLPPPPFLMPKENFLSAPSLCRGGGFALLLFQGVSVFPPPRLPRGWPLGRKNLPPIFPAWPPSPALGGKRPPPSLTCRLGNPPSQSGRLPMQFFAQFFAGDPDFLECPMGAKSFPDFLAKFSGRKTVVF